MDKQKYNQIRDCLRQLIKGTPFEEKVSFVGGCCRDDLMGLEIKDIDMAVNLPSGGIRLVEWLREQGHTTRSTVVYPAYQTARFHLKAFPDEELEVVQTRKEKYNDPACRNPETAFGSIQEDCMRRGLTITMPSTRTCRRASSSTSPAILQRTEKMLEDGTAMFGFKPWMTSNEVMRAKGIKPGKEVRNCLDYLLKLAFVNPKMDREEIVKHLRGYHIPDLQK